ncbi:MAG: (Fe-S)-binding protein [Ilumatobacteraceae bacterium]
MTLHLDDRELGSCVGCGLCLPHCPTFRVTGEEALSPRGRIAAMRAVQWEGAPVTPSFVSFMETCVQCRGCEPACPSGVPYGRLQEGVREALASSRRITPWWQRAAFGVLGRHRLLLAGSTALRVAQRFRLLPRRLVRRRLGIDVVPARGARVRSTGTDAWLFTGCVMDAWMRGTHRSTAAVLDHLGVGYRVTTAGCCGALHVHAGLAGDARRLAEAVMRSMPGDAPVVVNSAGCGAALKDYGHLLGTPEAAAFASRVVDACEFVAARADLLRPVRHLGRVAVHDPCHLRHVQRAHLDVRRTLRDVADLVELDNDGLCCGAGGAYSALQPDIAGLMRDRTLAAIARTGAPVIASANPGCMLHLAAGGVDVRHPMDLLAAALNGD